jgi:hypothetical protein
MSAAEIATSATAFEIAVMAVSSIFWPFCALVGAR